MEREADRQTFPYRNRIVAGWGSGLLVVEAGLNSGALITANQAVEQGRTVFAVPGPIDRPTSVGTNRLIQQGARLVTSAEDILDEMGSLFSVRQLAPGNPAAAQATPPAPKLSHDETLLVTSLEVGELSLDELVAATRLPISKVSSTLLVLEMKRLVKVLPGNRYTKA
jgi:DNA processing protein